jgi:outer membrane protein assembly factor BamB
MAGIWSTRRGKTKGETNPMTSKKRDGQRSLDGKRWIGSVLLSSMLLGGWLGGVGKAQGVGEGTPGHWPQWRGPESQGVSAERNLPTNWDESTNIRWKKALPGIGFSQPVIWGNRVFLTTDLEGAAAPEGYAPPKRILNGQEFVHPEWSGADKLHLFKTLCLDATTGELLWERVSYEGKVYDYRHKRGNYAAPSPVTDGTHVYTYFGSEGIYCYDFEGRLVWKRSIGQIGTVGMGVGTSPILHQNLVILQADQEFDGSLSFILALDRKTGEEVWRTARPVQSSWSTPVLIRTAERTELITSGNEWLIAYDPATGKEYWRTTGLKSHAIATPLVGEGLVIFSSGFPSKVMIAVRPGGSGNLDGTERIVWRYNKGTAYVPSPILYQGHVYLISDAGIMTCLDAKTGAVVYEGGRVPIATKFYGASPVAFDGKILLTSDDGDTFVIQAGPKHEVLATNPIGEPTRTSLALANGRLYLRGEKHLYCIEAPPPAGKKAE